MENSEWLISPVNPASSDVTIRFFITPGQKSVIMFLDLRASFLLRALYQIGTFSFTAAPPVQLSHVSLSPWPSEHLPVRPPTTHRITPRLRQMKCSCQAPYLNIWSNCSPLHVSPRTHLLSHEETRLPVTTFKEFLSSPPTTCHPCWISFPPTSSHLQQHCCPQRSTCWCLISLLSCMPCFFRRHVMSHPSISIYI